METNHNAKRKNIETEEAVRQAKAELRGIWCLDAEINALLREVERLRALMGILSGSGACERVQGSRRNDQIPRIVSKIIALEQQINGHIDRLVDRKQQAAYKVACLTNDTQRSVLTMRYLEGKSWEYIADALHYSLPQIYRIHGIALKSYGG